MSGRQATALVAATALLGTTYYALRRLASQRLAKRLLAMPKVELHVHLDGAFDTAVLFDFARRRLAAETLPPAIAKAVKECGDSFDAFSKLVTCSGPAEKTLNAMLEKVITTTVSAHPTTKIHFPVSPCTI